MGRRYKSEAEMRAAVQKRLKRKITDDDWAEYGSIDDFPPYDNQNVMEIVTRLRAANVKPVRQNQATAALTRAYLAVELVEDEVMKCRERIFGNPDPPFLDLATMMEWIKAEAASQPPAKGHAPQFGHKMEWSKVPKGETQRAFEKLGEENPGIYGVEHATLAVPQENGPTGYVIVSDGTQLRRLWLTMRSVAKQLDCEEAQATGYILTGRIPYVAPISATIEPSLGADRRLRGKITITIREPVSGKDVEKIYTKMRWKLWDKERAPKPPDERESELVKFVSERIDLEKPRWQKLMNEWNRMYPEWKFDYWQGFRGTYLRAVDKVYQPAKPWHDSI